MARIVLINLLLSGGSAWLHFVILRFMSDRLEALIARRKIALLLGVYGALLAHTIEIWLYALAFHWMISREGFGHLAGAVSGTLSDSFYFSISNYTSLGLGDIHAVGQIRFVAGFEALTGLVLITWTASFLFVEMQKVWGKGRIVR